MTHGDAITRAAIAALALGLVACGDDPPATQPAEPRKPSNQRQNNASPQQGGKKAALGYPKITEDYRREFRERDFVPDPSGNEKRDPFRSWVLRPSLDDSGAEVERADVCTEPNVRWGAQTYSIRDLQLVGIVKRGRSYAQFVDKSDKDSWVVRRGDCVGQEKAVIEEIGVGYVSLTITPEAPPGAPAPEPQRQDIPLYPEELEIPDAVMPEAGDDE